MRYFAHRQMLLGPVQLAITESGIAGSTTTEEAFDDFDGVVTCRFYVDAAEPHAVSVNGKRAALATSDRDDLYFTVEIDNKLRGPLSRREASTSWKCDDRHDAPIIVVVDEQDPARCARAPEDPEQIQLVIPRAIEEALQVALDEYRALAVDVAAITQKAFARGRAAMLAFEAPPEDDEDDGSSTVGPRL